MSRELSVAHCPNCGNVFQKNLRNLCAACTAEEDGQLASLEQMLKRNRKLTNEQLAEQSEVSEQRIRAYIRKGKLKLYDYPNLTDECDLCAGPIRQGKLCVSCTTRIKGDIRLDMERSKQQQAKHVFLSRNGR
ncbi:hypothetical protein [Paenibacillus silvisoli]|uniref:hypothetical protein n=1 Tax=Paenibacillus silvisoli TaxID=3110539 RepID=UPI002804CA9E|nr:hypothetical protein [Paenibacillus silvisoli]